MGRTMKFIHAALIVVFCTFLAGPVFGKGIFRKVYPDVPQFAAPGGDPGKPLFLSPLIKQGKISEAQNASKVVLPNFALESYSGFLTVNETYKSNMFFWFVKAKENADTAPVLLWLQGGPGASSLFSLFNENGPYAVTKNKTLVEKPFAWTNKYSMLYIDNPVGTGFSFTDDDKGYSNNEDDVAVNLYSALTQFFQLFPKLQQNEFFITGESYAGKYIPAIGSYIHMMNPKAKTKINMIGVAIGDGLCDPVTMLPAYSDLLYQISLIDENQKGFFESQIKKGVGYINSKQWRKAFDIFDMLLNGDKYPYPSYFKNVTGLSNYDNYLRVESPAEFGYYGGYLQMTNVRKAIHVGNLTYNDGSKVEDHLLDDMMQSVKDKVVTLANNYKILFYNGQLDIIVGNPLTEAFLKTLKWKKQAEYLKVDRFVWKVHDSDKEVAGYVRQVDFFYQVVVRNAGHILPYDQPERALDLIYRFVENKSFH